LITCVVLFLCPVSRMVGQEAVVGLRSDETEAEPSPIPQPPAEGPKKKKEKKESGLSERERLIKEIEQTMTPEEFEASGLNKLSVAELRSLQAWLHGYRQTTEAKATKKAATQAEANKIAEEKPHLGSNVDKIFSRVDGQFQGISGHTIIRLEDGTVWKQANMDDHLQARLTDHPPVSLSHNVFGYKMMVIGTGEFYVKPVKQ
jgi:hypothetical protein